MWILSGKIMYSMENIYKHMLKDLLKKKFRTISSEKGSIKNLGKLEIIEELYDHLGFDNIEGEEITPDQVMVRLYKTQYWLGQWVSGMLFGNSKNKLPFIFFYRINGLYFINNNVKFKFSKNESNQNNSSYQDNLCGRI